LLAVVIIGALVLAAVLGVYGQVNRAAEAILTRIDSPSWAAEVLQLIAKDLDRALGAENVTLQIRNGLDNTFQRGELVLRRTYHDNENKEQTLEQITWRAGYDHEGSSPGLILYRSYEGIGQEDKLFDDERQEWEKLYPFVPICRGLMFFQVQAIQGDQLLDQWPTSAPPPGVKITISFGRPVETVRGIYEVAERDKITRTVAIDVTRKIAFTLTAGADANQPPDANAPGPEASTERSSNRPSPPGQPPREQPTSERRSNERVPVQTRPR
jgi:hypothetical protein